jgi:hypothetical protein
MSIPDCQIEVDEVAVCETHRTYRPCYACYADELDRYHDEYRERMEGFDDRP